jgi:hypothetical protein
MPKYSGNDYELRIGRTKLDDKGEYIVRAVNSFGSKEESAVLNVETASPAMARRAMSVEPTSVRKKTYDEFEGYHEPDDTVPKFVFQLRDRFIQEGVGFKLLASVDGKPVPKVTWSKDGKQLKPGDRYDIVFSLGICSLEIASCEPCDAGRYTCNAENSKGSVETTSKVTVNEKKSYKITPMSDSSLSSSYLSSYSSGLGSSSSYTSSSTSSASSSSYSSSRSSRSTGGYRTTIRRTEYSRSISSMDRRH